MDLQKLRENNMVRRIALGYEVVGDEVRDDENSEVNRNEEDKDNSEECEGDSVEEAKSEDESNIAYTRENSVFLPNNSSNESDGYLKTQPQVSNEDFNENATKFSSECGLENFPRKASLTTAYLNQPYYRLPQYNARALSKHAKTYELETFEKNILIIFNQNIVDGYEPRHGTEKDVEAMTRTFQNVGFEVTEYRDLIKSQIMNELRTFFEQDFTNVGCIAIAVLTHGNDNGMLRAKDRAYNEEEITKYLESSGNPTLVTKPKILIIQACRGTKTNIGVAVRTASGSTHKDLGEDVEHYTMPVEADQLILHSTYVGNPSFRNTLEGSWLIQTLCDRIDQLAPTIDLESIITEVKREIAIDRSHEEYNKRTNVKEINKQIPVLISTLLRKLYLRKFGSSPVGAAIDEENQIRTVASALLEGQLNSEAADASISPLLKSPSILIPTDIDVMSKEYFLYLVNCLRYYISDNPEDTVAHSLLELSDTFGDSKKFTAPKQKMINTLCSYFTRNEEKIEYFKYLFIKKNETPG